MPSDAFMPQRRVLNRNQTPQPILPVNYAYFLAVKLPSNLSELSLEEKLLVAERMINRRTFYRSTGPFGRVVGYEFRCAPNVTIYLTMAGEFKG